MVALANPIQAKANLFLRLRVTTQSRLCGLSDFGTLWPIAC